MDVVNVGGTATERTRFIFGKCYSRVSRERTGGNKRGKSASDEDTSRALRMQMANGNISRRVISDSSRWFEACRAFAMERNDVGGADLQEIAAHVHALASRAISRRLANRNEAIESQEYCLIIVERIRS